MQNSITDACNAAKKNLVSVIMSSGGDPAATVAANNELKELESFKTLFETLLKG
jgi:hypothetical protein